MPGHEPVNDAFYVAITWAEMSGRHGRVSLPTIITSITPWAWLNTPYPLASSCPAMNWVAFQAAWGIVLLQTTYLSGQGHWVPRDLCVPSPFSKGHRKLYWSLRRFFKNYKLQNTFSFSAAKSSLFDLGQTRVIYPAHSICRVNPSQSGVNFLHLPK